ncbi:ROK family protein [Neobacillus sp. NPDC058068]|uniref:ROK family protein n=1 Tax=Neobacillus sp. NPDC058068 TaxID=3346325 RepID=UPI0036DE249B
MEDKVIGVDIGGTNIRVGLISSDFQLLKKETAMTSDYQSAKEFFEHIRLMIERIDIHKEAKKIGIALPVPWKDGMEKFQDATNIPFLENASVSEIKVNFPGYELYFENDVNAIALLESHHGASKNSKHSMYITVSTGIGSGIILNNSIYRGTNGYAGEIGSMIISDINKNHFLRYYGTLESLCSGIALEEESIKLYGNGATAKYLFEQYHHGDESAYEVVEAWINYFSSALASLMQTIDPEVFVLGGAVIYHNQWLIDKLIEPTKNKVFAQLKDKVKIEIAKFGPDVGIIGASYIASSRDQKDRNVSACGRQ